MDNEPEHKVSKRGRVDEGHPTKRTLARQVQHRYETAIPQSPPT